MKFETHKSIINVENGESYDIGDVVTIKRLDGSGAGSCKIVKITDTGFHYSQGGSKKKNVQYKDIEGLDKYK
ncbi:hypothetical protein M2454_000763 [Aequitasia blattaphilus]|uniref:DUF2158 domain-containing protein n=1 Tax=Aequitasia blattaphilus TaxID=2949332 RepID=A0ABT1E825_9FIRM|nr:hypothetical protein [Aequitasia blattaphilus]MCP1101970.1 hypothetical protein [Aequitasia blattaphilus]MCR8614610.1 hypothetical protein [Aequitasia blattaphilus]